MSAPGWYPDPSGAPNQYRYWDGTQWSAQTMPAGGPPNTTGAPMNATGGRRGPRWGLITAGIAALVVIGLVTMWLVRPQGQNVATEDSNTAAPTGSQWAETARPSTPPPTAPAPSQATLAACPVGASTPTNTYPDDGRIHGGELKFTKVPAWPQEYVRMSWVHDHHSQTHQVIPGRWFSMVSVGALKTSDGFEDPQTSAYQVMSCFATSTYYQGYKGRENVLAEPVTIDGRPGFHLRTEIYIEDTPTLPNIKGDVVDVIVVDTDNPESLGVFISSATIDDDPIIATVDRAIESLAVDK